MKVVTNVEALNARMNKAELVCEGGGASKCHEAAIFRDEAGFFGVIERFAEGDGSSFKSVDLSERDAQGFSKLCANLKTSYRTTFLIRALKSIH